ncbi:alginate lyase family protein [Vitreimonas sp.]|uniref:alginate lyase family protein n=1 Tax=Vitreimonas sp. TaxID=3069702 RepID=UPI002ED9D631
MTSLLKRARTFALLRFKQARRSLENMMTPPTSLDKELDETGRSFAEFLRQRRSAPRHYVELGRAHIAALKTREPQRCALLVEDANRIVRHEFDLLGSGFCLYADPERSPRRGYQPIDWYFDPVRNLRFPRKVPYNEWKLYEMRPANADVKFPWELSRSQHWVTLGQAWALTGDAKYAQEIADQLDDFMEANPVGFGVNWTCTMDVGLRAANWCLGLALVQDAKVLDNSFWRRAYGALFEHGRFIRANLENTYEVTSNHFLSNVIGLHYLGAEFADVLSGQRWYEFAEKALETEIDVQVLPDGADFESAVPYHRLVTELFLGSARLCQFRGAPLSSHYHDVLTKMVDYVVGVMRPDGLMPVIGDADDGRLHIFSDQGRWDRQDARHLLGPAALLLNRTDWLAARGGEAVWESVWWGFDPADVPSGAGSPPAFVQLFPDTGVAIARRGSNYLAVTNGVVGTKGFGNHKHNELLGFELHVDGAPVFIDTGSYVYTSDFDARNMFRSTAAHNTLMVDGVEQNEVNPEWIFRMFEKADPKHEHFGEEGDIIIYRGSHTGYARLAEPVTHARCFRFDLASGALVITDEVTGSGRHHLDWFFHAAPGVGLELAGAGAVSVDAGGVSLRLTHDPRLKARIEPGWVAPSYGVRRPSKTLVLSWDGELGPPLITESLISRA